MPVAGTLIACMIALPLQLAECSNPDDDGDGYTPDAGDCDDSDPAVHPGALEACDKKDNDCDNETDEIWPVLTQDGLVCEYTIQEGIEAAITAGLDGTIIWVAAGTYLEHGITFRGHDFRLVATYGPDLTFVDGEGLGSVFVFTDGETSASMVQGFTIQNGGGAQGGGIYVKGSSPTFAGLHINDNDVLQAYPLNAYGGGMYFENSNSIITGCRITQNDAWIVFGGYEWDNAQGGGIYAIDSLLTIENSTVESNTAGYGGGVYFENTYGLITDTVVTSNTAALGAGLHFNASSPHVTQTWVHSNYATNKGYEDASGGGVFLHNSNAVFSHTRIEGNTANGPYYQGLYMSAYGGGVFVDSGEEPSQPLFQNCLITNNTTRYDFRSSTGGAGVFATGSNTVLRLDHVVVTNNRGVCANCSTYNKSSVGGLYLFEATATVTNSVIAYNPYYNIYQYSGGFADVGYSDLYAVLGQNNHNISTLHESVLTVEPGFLTYDAAGQPTDYHLALSSSLIDAGITTQLDADNSRADIGMYGGSEGDQWDRDDDGVPDYFWAGTLADAPPGFDPAQYDCNDNDAGVQTNCP